jgi:hypothetical protein
MVLKTLMAIKNPCFEILSAKTTIDGMVKTFVLKF